MLSALIERLERATERLERLRPEPRLGRRLLQEFLSGLARGIGFSVGFTILGALLLYLLRNMAMANLPVIGRFIAQIVRIVERSL